MKALSNGGKSMTSKLDLVKACLLRAELLGFGPSPCKTGANVLLGPKSVTAMVGAVPKLPRTVAAKIGGPKTSKPV